MEEAGGEEVTAGADNAAIVADAVNNADVNTEDNAGWLHADGVQGEGDAPDWFKGGKYKSVSEQAKAYSELEGKFGSFTGAPDEYALELSDELTEQGVVIDKDDVLLTEAHKFAKDAGMNQEGFNQMINLYAMSKLAEAGAASASKQDEIKLLGNNAQTRIDNINKWAGANLDEDMMQGFEEMTTTAASVQALEQLIAMTRNAPVSPVELEGASVANEAEVKAMQFEKDENGNRKINTDPEFKKRYLALRDQVYGSEDHRVVIG